MDLLEGLNIEQKEAILSTDGPFLVLAGAGSGKTGVITRRFAYLLDHFQLDVSQILAITFTNKAAKEMQNRIYKYTGKNVFQSWVRTFHSMGVRILREHAPLVGLDKNFTIYDTSDSCAVVKLLMQEKGLSSDQFKPESIYYAIARAKDYSLQAKDLRQEANSALQEVVASLYPLYHMRLQENQACDFSDLITKPLDILEQHASVRAYYQELWRYVMVDEFQDTNKAQYNLICALTNTSKNICAVGDDDQAIYAWRGADVTNIRSFQNDFAPMVITLNQNYRSATPILRIANQVVGGIPNRLQDKQLWGRHPGELPVQLVVSEDSLQEAQAFRRFVENWRTQGFHYKHIALLYRTNAQSRIFEQVLNQHPQIPHRIYGAQSFYDRMEIKDLMAYVRLLVNPWDRMAFERVVSTPKRGIGNVTMAKLHAYSQEHGVDYLQTLQQSTSYIDKPAKLMELSHTLEDLGRMMDPTVQRPSEWMLSLIDRIGYQDYLSKLDNLKYQDRWDNVQELVSSLGISEQEHEDFSITRFLEDVSLMIDNKDETQNNKVFLMSIHAAKGLEFHKVFIAGLADGLLPHQNNVYRPEKIAEEQRLLYVAVTRACDELILSYPKRRFMYGNYVDTQPSRFLEGMDGLQVQGKQPPGLSAYLTPPPSQKKPPPVELIPLAKDDIKTGIRLYHRTYGFGKVTKATHGAFLIHFEDYGLKAVSAGIRTEFFHVP